ncbi:hypothetical protein [sulfur-oxidizing endosymbiont of Gigantopelta aegis]|uniref:hypothetical protein n=1 Tax=sulfur-oxidizing endosymbiont of Gigantopelta aegis TaxID=2794934 RepID=UPI0018DE318E|nr:hypothetical protein [sulfur-oxidizing endosymbiont of Gigantopelta aegis]
MNQWGDLTWNFKENSQEIEADAYDSLLLEPSEYFIEHYKILLQLAQQRNLQLIFTWSVSLKSALFNLDDFEDRQKVQNFKANLNKIGIDIDIKGELKDVHFTQDFFFDTSKHLNQEGVKIRTQALKNVIRENIR